MISSTDATLAAMQMKQLELLKELDRVSKLIGVHYYLASGTCLGALRHQGFIPWDDDVDVYMFWDDVDALVANQDVFQEWCFIQTKNTDPEVKTTHCRIRDSRTSLLLEEERGLNINHGVFIDVYILYPFPDGAVKAKKILFDSFVYRVLVSGEGPRNHGAVAAMLGNAVVKLHSDKSRREKIAKIEREYRFNGGKDKVATYFGRDVSLSSVIVYPRQWFEEPRQLLFEDMIVNCPGNTEEYCRLQYGDSYMELPPMEKRTPHHDYIYCDMNVPYTEAGAEWTRQ